MPRYIDAEKFYKLIQDQLDDIEVTGTFSKGQFRAFNIVKSMLSNKQVSPTADVQEVKHGKWIFDGECGITKCSNCKWSIEEYFTNPNTRKPYVHCPNCGAIMDLEE